VNWLSFGKLGGMECHAGDIAVWRRRGKEPSAASEQGSREGYSSAIKA